VTGPKDVAGLRDALLANITTWTIASPHWEDDAELVYGYIAHDLDALIAAAPAEEAAKGLTVEALAKAASVIELLIYALRFHNLDPDGDIRPCLAGCIACQAIEAWSDTDFAALTPTPPPPADPETWGSHVFQPGASAPDRCLWTDGRWSACKAPGDAWCHRPVATPPPPAATVERCETCDGPRDHWRHGFQTYSDHPDGHPFTPEPK
jgi:hypothetical protein